jgi:hypothetical protein
MKLLGGGGDRAIGEADQKGLGEIDRFEATMPLEEVWGDEVSAGTRIDEECGLHTIEGDLDREQLMVEVSRGGKREDLSGVFKAVVEAVGRGRGGFLTGALKEVLLEEGAWGARDEIPTGCMRPTPAPNNLGRGATGGEGGRGVLKEILVGIEEFLGGWGQRRGRGKLGDEGGQRGGKGQGRPGGGGGRGGDRGQGGTGGDRG